MTAPSTLKQHCSNAGGAVTNCTLLVSQWRDFLPLLEHNWPLAEAVLKMVCERTRPQLRVAGPSRTALRCNAKVSTCTGSGPLFGVEVWP